MMDSKKTISKKVMGKDPFEDMDMGWMDGEEGEFSNGPGQKETEKEDLIESVDEKIQPAFEPAIALEESGEPEDGNIISLEEMIAETDREIGEVSVPEHREEKIAYGLRQYIRFSLEDIMLGITLSSSVEIGHLPDITPLPNLPEWILGISNIRGEIISVVDLKGFFGWPSHGHKRGSRFIVVHNEDLKVGIMVDAITGILSMDKIDTDVQNNPFGDGEISSFIRGVVAYEEQLLHILDIDKLLSSLRMSGFRAE